MLNKNKLRPSDPIELKAPETKESFLNKNWRMIRTSGGGYHIEKTTEAVGYSNTDGDETWIAPGSYIMDHRAIKELGYTNEALQTAIEDWIDQEGGTQLNLAA